jgi:hypothetical protein
MITVPFDLRVRVRVRARARVRVRVRARARARVRVRVRVRVRARVRVRVRVRVIRTRWGGSSRPVTAALALLALLLSFAEERQLVEHVLEGGRRLLPRARLRSPAPPRLGWGLG